MSRDKENNNPLPRQPRAVGSVFIGKQPTPPSAEFFTDSLLEDTSRIPSPSPLKKKHGLSNPRRVLSQTKSLPFSKDSANALRRANTTHDAAKRGIRHQQPAPTLQRPLSMRSSQSDLITPPQSRDGPNAITSPTSEASNPPQDLTDTYQRIYDEELLATTERDDLSSEGDENERGYRQNSQSPSGSPRPRSNRDAVIEHRRARSATPDVMPDDGDKENVREEHTGAFSEGSGMSFLNQLTDQNLAAKATPLVSSHVKDMRRLQQGISTRPISFNAGTKPSEFIADDARSNASSDRSSRSSRRRGLRFSSPVINGAPPAQPNTNLVHPRDSPSQASREPSSAQTTKATAPHSQSPREPLRELPLPVADHDGEAPEPAQISDDESDVTAPELRERERQFELNQARKLFGIPAYSNSVNDANRIAASATGSEAVHERTDDRGEDLDDLTEHSKRSDHSAFDNDAAATASTRIPITNKGILKKWRQSAAEQRAERTQDAASDVSTSAVDWLGVDADAPVPSIEADADDQTDAMSAGPSSRPRGYSDHPRKFDNETTGMSFQVSESPPVKQRKSIDDLAREREIDQLSRQAVTKSRLEAIREKDPREAHRRLSRSPSGSSLRKSTSSDATKRENAGSAGEQIPDTPIVVFRSSSGSSKDASRSDHDRRASHDALQRFARLSATPKSSPSTTPKTNTASAERQDVQVEERAEIPLPKRPAVAATPKISGSWTDTILPPDTVGTVAQQKQQPKYAQTPHVNAGGWVDTPLPQTAQRPDIPESIEEATEEITTDVAAAVADDLRKLREATEANRQPQMGPSALTNILAAQRNRDPAGNDTLNLGETTIASLEDLVDLNEEDMTTLIRMGAEHDALRQLHGTDVDDPQSPRRAGGSTAADGGEAEIVVLDRLAKKLHTLQANIRHARKAASRFEREMSEGVADGTVSEAETAGHSAGHVSVQATSLTTKTSPATVLNPNGMLPLTLAPLRIPVPLLFHPSTEVNRKPSAPGLRNKIDRARRFGKPTPLLYLLLALLFYRFVEIFLSEIYAHPLYAESYSWPDVPSVSTSAKGIGGNVFVASTEPEPGFVIPSLIARNLWGGDAEGVKQFVDNAKRGIGGVFSAGLGWLDGSEREAMQEEESVAQKGAGHSANGQGRSGVAVDDQGWSMLDDEVL